MTGRMIKVAASLTTAITLVASSAYADTLKMNPGNWESTTVMNSPFTGTQTTTQTQCVEEEEFNPSQFLQGQEDCKMVEQNVSGNTLSFTMACNAEGMTSTMNGEMTISDDSGKGHMKMMMEVAGQKFDMTMDFTSRRLGGC